MIYPYQEIVNPFLQEKFLDVEMFFLILLGSCGSLIVEAINVWLDRFNEMRKSSGMSLDEISAKSGVPKGTLSKITAGITKAPPLETMRKLVYSMGYTLDDLDDNPPKSKNSPRVAEATPGEEHMLSLYRELNQEGQEKLLDYADDLVASGKYIKSDPNQLGKAKRA